MHADRLATDVDELFGVFDERGSTARLAPRLRPLDVARHRRLVIHEPPTQATFGSARYSGALAAVDPARRAEAHLRERPGERLQRLDAADDLGREELRVGDPALEQRDACPTPSPCRAGTARRWPAGASSSVGVAPGRDEEARAGGERVVDLRASS